MVVESQIVPLDNEIEEVIIHSGESVMPAVLLEISTITIVIYR